MSTLGVEERRNGRSVRVVLGLLDEKLFGNLLIRDNDKTRAKHLGIVDGTMDICELLELDPHLLDRHVMNASNDRK